MSKRTRQLSSDDESDEETNTKKQKKNKKRDPKDVTILIDLKNAGLVDFLWEKVGKLEKVEHSECLKSSKLPLDSKGYCKNLRLMKKGLEKGTFTKEMSKKKCFIKKDYQWSATGLVLVKNGQYPSDANNEASHLCNHPWCLNVKHLLWEIPKKLTTNVKIA